MAHKKAGGSSKNGRDSESKRLGVKVYGGQAINAGGIKLRIDPIDHVANINIGKAMVVNDGLFRNPQSKQNQRCTGAGPVFATGAMKNQWQMTGVCQTLEHFAPDRGEVFDI